VPARERDLRPYAFAFGGVWPVCVGENLSFSVAKGREEWVWRCDVEEWSSLEVCC
jgi:hypothetical protein